MNGFAFVYLDWRKFQIKPYSSSSVFMRTNNVECSKRSMQRSVFVYWMRHGENGVRQQNNNNSQFGFFSFQIVISFSKRNERKKEQKFSVCCTFDIRKCDWRTTTRNYGASGAILVLIHLRRMCNTRRNVSSSSSSTTATASHTNNSCVLCLVPCACTADSVLYPRVEPCLHCT